MSKIVLIGSGNLAEALALALSRSSAEFIQIYARNPERGAHIARLTGVEYTNSVEGIAKADIYILAVSDRAIESLASELNLPIGSLVLHTAGSVSIDSLHYPHRGSLYPFQSFTKGRRVDFSQIPIFVEASDPESEEQTIALAQSLSTKVYRATSELRQHIHLVGVYACNFVNAMYTMADEHLRNVGLDFSVVTPLIKECMQKAVESQNPASMQTGPAVRGDRGVIEGHLKLINNDKQRLIYEQISDYIWEISKRTLPKPRQ